MPARDLEIFLRFIFPWDDPKHDQLYKCVTTFFPSRRHPNGKGVVNYVAQGYDDLIRLIEKQSNWSQGEVYVALGTQRMADTKVSKDGSTFAVRQGHNMVSFNSLFVDVDLGKNGGYASTADAELGLQQFLASSGMPQPTMIVRSGGGGMHLYWCTAEPMPVSVWQPLADGLKACAKQLDFRIDEAITADSARILRVPTTLNYKYGTPRVVLLDTASSALVQYTAAYLTGVLSSYMVAQRSKTGTTGSTGPVSGASAWTQNFTGGVDERSFPKLAIDVIAVNCPMTAQTLNDGGAGKSEPDWSQDMFLAAWTEDPVDAAHRLSRGHVGYDPASTDKKLAEKQAAIASGKLGWPKCSSFNHAACKTCPLLAHDRSPVLFGHRVAPAAQPLQPKYTDDPLMPRPYYRNANDHVLISTEDAGPIDVLGYPILDGFIDSITGELVLKTSISGKDRWGAVAINKHTGAGVCEALAKGTRNGIIVKGSQTIAKNFAMAWVTHLQNRKRMTTPQGFGWYGDGFVFGDDIYTPAGPQSTYRGNTIDDKYQRIGELQPWLDAMQLIYGNAPLEIIVASSFAAPLVELACDNSLVLSLYSHQSGFGKSTAMKLAQAVWGHPRTGMSMYGDTVNATMKKITDLKNLPILWDELKTKEQTDEIVGIVFGATQGRSKARLSRSSDSMPIGMATTMFVVASNHGIINAVARHTEGTDSGGLRVFEIEAQPIVNKVPDHEALVIPLNENYGVAGAIFIDFIVKNKAAIKQVSDAISEQLQQACRFETKERFWKNAMVTVLTGANVANASGLTRFDITAMQAYLYEALRNMRMNTLTQSYTLAGPNAGEGVLAEMMADLRARNMINTNIVPVPQLGRPNNVVMDDVIDLQRAGDIWFQHGVDDGRILCRVRAFVSWLVKRKYDPDQVLKLLKQDYVIYVRKASIGAGIALLKAVDHRADCYDMTPHVPPPAKPSRNPSSPSANFG